MDECLAHKFVYLWSVVTADAKRYKIVKFSGVGIFLSETSPSNRKKAAVTRRFHARVPSLTYSQPLTQCIIITKPNKIHSARHLIYISEKVLLRPEAFAAYWWGTFWSKEKWEFHYIQTLCIEYTSRSWHIHILYYTAYAEPYILGHKWVKYGPQLQRPVWNETKS